MTRLLSLLAIAALAACGEAVFDPDARTIDATDANVRPDAAPAPLPPGQEVAPAAGRLSGGTWTADVEVGSPYHPHTGAPFHP